MKICQRLMRKTEYTIKKNALITEGDKVLIAFSGGGDSIFLLHMLSLLKDKYGFSIAAAHLNHALRAEADAEEQFARETAQSVGAEFYSKKADIERLAAESGESCETAGRRLRYEFFGQLMSEHGFNKLATAHHRDDNAETILMHFLRGSGANGLKGIEYMRADGIIRPILDISKQEISDCCHEQGWEYVTDSSNFEPIYTRNRVRLELIPEILKYNPNFAEVVTRNARLFAEDEAFISNYTEKIFKENFSSDGLLKSAVDSQMPAIQKRLIQSLYHEYIPQNLSIKYIDAILSLEKSGQRTELPGGMTAILSYGRYKMKKREQTSQEFEYDIIPGEELYIPELNQIWILERTEKKDDKYAFSAKLPFKVRSKRIGDVFYPIGMQGRKKISDLLCEKKIPRDKRDKIPILTSGGEIVNINGKYRDRRFYKPGKEMYILKIKNVK